MEKRLKFAITVLFLASASLLLAVNGAAQGQTTVTIRGYYDEAPESMRDKNTIVISGYDDENFVEIVVRGTIYDFEYVELEWSDEKNDFVEIDTMHKLDTVKDRTIVIKTYIPGGIPFERVKWKSATGKEYEFTIEKDFREDSPGYWEFVCE